MNKPPRAAIPVFSRTHTRRDVLKSAVAGAGALALSAMAPLSPGGRALAHGGMSLSLDGDEMLPREKFTIQSTIAVNMTRSFATAPLFQARSTASRSGTSSPTCPMKEWRANSG